MSYKYINTYTCKSYDFTIETNCLLFFCFSDGNKKQINKKQQKLKTTLISNGKKV